MPRLLSHEGVVFKDQVIYATGHAYENCRFERCTIFSHGLGYAVFRFCTFAGCVWHLDMIVHDPDQWDAFITGFAPMITKSLVRGGAGPMDNVGSPPI